MALFHENFIQCTMRELACRRSTRSRKKCLTEHSLFPAPSPRRPARIAHFFFFFWCVTHVMTSIVSNFWFDLALASFLFTWVSLLISFQSFKTSTPDECQLHFRCPGLHWMTGCSSRFIWMFVFLSYFLIENNVFDETTPLCHKSNLISLSFLNDHNPGNPGIHLPEC
jgi:hypothetical protein